MGKARGRSPGRRPPQCGAGSGASPKGVGSSPPPHTGSSISLAPSVQMGKLRQGHGASPPPLRPGLSFPSVGCAHRQLDPAPRPPSASPTAVVAPLPRGWRERRAGQGRAEQGGAGQGGLTRQGRGTLPAPGGAREVKCCRKGDLCTSLKVAAPRAPSPPRGPGPAPPVPGGLRPPRYEVWHWTCWRIPSSKSSS